MIASLGSMCTGCCWDELRGDDKDSSSGEDGVYHLHHVRQLLDPVRRRPALRQLRQSPAARSSLLIHAGAPARQPQTDTPGAAVDPGQSLIFYICLAVNVAVVLPSTAS